MRLYQILNSQYQPVKFCETFDEAKSYIATLQEVYTDKFHVIELALVYTAPEVRSDK